MRKGCWLVAAAVCLSVQWTRFTGVVKALNLRESSLTLELKGGEIVTIPVDYQVKIKTKKDSVVRQLKDLELDDKVVVTQIPAAEPPKDETFQEMNSGAFRPK